MEDKSKKILSEVSAGELLDKISILEIKLEKISDKSSLEQLKKEYSIYLTNISDSELIYTSSNTSKLFDKQHQNQEGFYQ